MYTDKKKNRYRYVDRLLTCFVFFPSPLCRIPCFFFVRFCPFVLSFSVWFLYRLLRFYFRFPDFLGGGFYHSAIILLFRLGATPPPRSLRAWSMRVPLACCLLSSFLRCWCWLILILSSLPSLFRFRFGHRLFSSCLFLVGTMLSPRFRFLLRLVQHMIYTSSTSIYICILIRTYVDLTFWFSSEVYVRFASVSVWIILCFFLFSSWGNFPLQSYWSLSCDRGLHCSDE